jgi:hypothetical protein
MPQKQYYVPNMPDEELHKGFQGLINRIRAVTGVHEVTIDRGRKNVTVHLHDEDYLPNVDQAILEFGQLPGFTGQA